MAHDRFGALRPLADLSGIAAFGAAIVGTIFSAVKVTKEFVADWPWIAQALFYIGVFLVVYACASGGIREVVRLYRWFTKGIREPAIPVADSSGVADASVLPQILSGVTEMLEAHAHHLDRVDADTQRQKAATAEDVTRRVREENEALLRRFQEAERHAQESESAARVALGAEATLLGELKAAKADHEKQVEKAVEMLADLTKREEDNAPVFTWASALLKREAPLSRWLHSTDVKRCLFNGIDERIGPHSGSN